MNSFDILSLKIAQLPPLVIAPADWTSEMVEEYNTVRNEAIRIHMSDEQLEEKNEQLEEKSESELVEHVVDVNFVFKDDDIDRFYMDFFVDFGGSEEIHFRHKIVERKHNSYQTNMDWVSSMIASNSNCFGDTVFWEYLEEKEEVDVEMKSKMHMDGKLIVCYTIKWMDTPLMFAA